MRQLDLTSRLRPNVLELKLPNADRQCRVTIGRCLDGSLLPRIVPSVKQYFSHYLVCSVIDFVDGLVGEKERAFGVSYNKETANFFSVLCYDTVLLAYSVCCIDASLQGGAQAPCDG